MVRGSGSHSGRIARKEEKKPRGSREGIHKERHQDVRRGHGRTGWLSVIVKVQTRILQALSEWERFAERKRVGAVRRHDRPCDSESVELERGWTVGGVNGHYSVADFDAHRVGCSVAARVFQTIGWSECWCTRATHAEANWWEDCGAQHSSYVSDGTDKRELLGERADGQSCWMDS